MNINTATTIVMVCLVLTACLSFYLGLLLGDLIGQARCLASTRLKDPNDSANIDQIVDALRDIW